MTLVPRIEQLAKEEMEGAGGTIIKGGCHNSSFIAMVQ